MKIFKIILRVLLGIMLIMPVIGAFGLMPEPTSDMYNSEAAYAFIMALMSTKYIMYMMASVFLFSLVLTVMNRMAAVALLLLPITLNIVAFHAVLDGGIFTAGAVMGDVLLLINLFFLWESREVYKPLFDKR